MHFIVHKLFDELAEKYIYYVCIGEGVRVMKGGRAAVGGRVQGTGRDSVRCVSRGRWTKGNIGGGKGMGFDEFDILLSLLHRSLRRCRWVCVCGVWWSTSVSSFPRYPTLL